MADPPSWGDGLSTGLVEALQGAGIESAWIGTSDWREALWHPEAVEAAKNAGYLVGTYDSYASAHPEDLADSWQTAQQGQAIFDDAAYTNEDGSTVTGFAGRGAYVNPLRVAEYARIRMKAVSEAAGFNSYFIDVDATGLSYNDYSEDHPTGRALVMAELQDRIGYIANDLELVTGSEGGTALFGRDLVFGHGITTPPFGWMDGRLKRDRESAFYLGGYWPEEAPPIYFKQVPVPDEMAEFMYAPEYRLPLYQIALHDSIIATHHWEYGSLKPVGQRDRIGLTQILYMVPPLYHLHDSVMTRDLPVIEAYHKTWRPLHADLWDQQMTGFVFLSEDRLVQRTEFANGTRLTVNFDDRPRQLSTGETLPVRGIAVENTDGTRIIVMPAID
nr:glycoside hydrolase [Aquisalinus flavus]